MARDWHAVATVTTRLAQLDMTQQELSNRSQVSVAMLRQIQRGAERHRSPRTLAAVSEALDWFTGHLADVADGRSGSSEASAAATPRDELAALRQTIEMLADRLDAVERRLTER